MSDKKRVFEGMASHVDNDPENTYCLRDKYGCMASTDVDWLGRLLGQNVRITIEPLPVAPPSDASCESCDFWHTGLKECGHVPLPPRVCEYYSKIEQTERIADELQPSWKKDWPECHCFHDVCCGLLNPKENAKCRKCKWSKPESAPGPGADDSNGGKI